jgi:hypothetical protein
MQESMMSNNTFIPGPTLNTVRAADGRILTAPEGWVLLPPGDAALSPPTPKVEPWISNCILDESTALTI